MRTSAAALAVLVQGAVLLAPLAAAPAAHAAPADPRLAKASREAPRNGWIPVHLEGAPGEIGFQHGSLLAPEIEDAFRAIQLALTHKAKPWPFWREAAEKALWPKIEAEYREELQGIVEGLVARGVKLDIWDLVAMNAWLELSPYYENWHNRTKGDGKTEARPVGEHCSAFVATGSWTKDGRVVIAHNNWTDYGTGSRWNVIFDIVPARGHRFLMDGMPGLIHSADDFGLNAAGILITETTISQFDGFDPEGIPEFVRARKAMQYSASIDDFARLMKEGNNGAYANNWLVADRTTNEIASLELGLRNVILQRTKDGYFAGSNMPADPKLVREETTFPADDKGMSANARHLRWEALMKEHRGRIDVDLAQRFLADHLDTFTGLVEPGERTLCGHVERSPRGLKPWQPPFGVAGTVQNKAADAAMAGSLCLTAAMGHSCGIHFKAEAHLAQHPEFRWMQGVLRDLNAHPWTRFYARR